MDAEWSSLPPDLIRLIANQLPAVEDYTALTAVSRSFRSATKKYKWCPTDVSPAPWLLLSPLDDDKGRSDINRPRGLSSMYRGRKKFYLKLPELHDRRCWGSAYGWIISLGLDRQLQLFNPLTRRLIVLPKPKFDDAKWKEGEDYKSKWMRLNFFNRCMLIKKSHPSRSSTNFLDDFFVVIAGPVEGLFRVLKHDRWEDVSSSVRGCISDFISYKDQFYALGRCGQLFVCSNFDGPEQATASLVVPPDPRFMGMVTEKYYIVELMGELVMVVRYMERQGPETPRAVNFVGRLYYTLRFEVFKLDMEAKKWVKIEDDLGGCALFVGDCPSISLSQPEYFNCRSNCIYYTDDNYQLFGCSKRVRRYPFGCVGGYNTGIFDFKQGRNESLYQEHPWLQNATSAPNVSLGETVKARLKQFSVMNKLKKRPLRVIADHLSDEEVNGLKEAFEIMDINKRGKIDLGEFRTGLQKLGHPMAEDDLLVLMEVADVDGDGALNYGEFVAVAVHLRKMGIEEHLHKAFTFFDRSQSGFIEIEELRDALSDDDDAKSEEVINAIMHDVDTDKDGCISYEEFAAMMKAGTDWRKASRQYSRDRFNSLSLKLMKDGSVKIANEGR